MASGQDDQLLISVVIVLCRITSFVDFTQHTNPCKTRLRCVGASPVRCAVGGEGVPIILTIFAVRDAAVAESAFDLSWAKDCVKLVEDAIHLKTARVSPDNVFFTTSRARWGKQHARNSLTFTHTVNVSGSIFLTTVTSRGADSGTVAQLQSIIADEPDTLFYGEHSCNSDVIWRHAREIAKRSTCSPSDPIFLFVDCHMHKLWGGERCLEAGIQLCKLPKGTTDWLQPLKQVRSDFNKAVMCVVGYNRLTKRFSEELTHLQIWDAEKEGRRWVQQPSASEACQQTVPPEHRFHWQSFGGLESGFWTSCVFQTAQPSKMTDQLCSFQCRAESGTVSSLQAADASCSWCTESSH